MEEKKSEHLLSITNREKCKLTGIRDVVQFNDKILIVNTSVGRLEIIGNNFHVTGFDEKNGELILDGFINSMKYSGMKSAANTTKGIAGRLFR